MGLSSVSINFVCSEKIFVSLQKLIIFDKKLGVRLKCVWKHHQEQDTGLFANGQMVNIRISREKALPCKSQCLLSDYNSMENIFFVTRTLIFP